LTTRGAFRVDDNATVIRISPNRVLTTIALLSLLFTALVGTLAALTFLVATFVLWARNPTQAIVELFRYWPFFLLPLWCLLTMFWSRDPAVSLRYGLQLSFTCLVAVAIATRLSPRDFLWALFTVHAVAAACSMALPNPVGEGGAWLGIFGSKNAFAFTMSNLALTSLALVLDRRTGRQRRWLVFFVLLLSLFLLLMGRSTGALVTTTLAMTLGLSLAGLWRLPTGTRFLLVALVILGMSAAGLVAWAFSADLSRAFLDATGKDMTLTGRTELWAAAFREISYRPLLGQGYQAVWLPGNPVAEAMWAKFQIESKSGFNFHSTWISNAVEIGIIGAGLQAALFTTSLVLVGRWVLLSPSAPSIYFAMFMMQMAPLSFVEVVLYSQFALNTIIAIAALIYGIRFRAETQMRPASHQTS
jgi:exopolysaccharide production protein ExoQ